MAGRTFSPYGLFGLSHLPGDQHKVRTKMKSPSSPLPDIPLGKHGWPWTNSDPYPTHLIDNRPWPKISIVTPNYNCGEFLEETIRSVLLQGYPNLEYIIIDGGSTDGSLEIIKRYEPWLAYWITQSDQGQSAAINNGFRRASGEIMGWLNSDDYYQPNTLFRVALEVNPEKKRYIVMGEVHEVDARKRIIRRWKSRVPTLYSLLFQHRLCLLRGVVVMPCQPSVFWHRKVFESLGLLREDLKYAMDYDYWLKALRSHYHFQYMADVLSNYRFHAGSKSSQGWQIFYREWRSVAKENFSTLTPRQKISAEIYWWFLLFPLSILTLPYRVFSYVVLGIKRG